MSLKQTIRKKLIEQREFSPELLRRLETFKSIVWNNFATNYPCDYDDFSHFMRAIRNEINDIILEGVDIDGSDMSWLTIEEAMKYVEKYMKEDLKEFYVSRCLE